MNDFKKVLLIRPPIAADSYKLFCSKTIGYLSEATLPIGIPLGLLYIGKAFEDEDFEVEIYDALMDFDIEEAAKKRFEFNKFYLGASRERIKERIKSINPDIVGINSQFTKLSETAVNIVRLVKEINNDIKVLVGGPDATINPEKFIFHNGADIVVLGEGELTVKKIVEWINGKNELDNIYGLAYSENGNLIKKPLIKYLENIDEIGIPAYHLIDMEKYFKLEKLRIRSREKFEYPGSERYATIVTSRGCPYNCIFCTVNIHMSKKWRCHSIDYVIEHIKYLKKNYGINHIHFEDDNISLNINRFEAMIDRIIKEQLNITWDTPNGLRVEKLNKNLLEKCKKSGCSYLCIGIESGDQLISDNVVGKDINLKDIEEFAMQVKDTKFDAKAFYLIGFPGENINNINNTVNFAWRLLKKYDVYPYLNLAQPAYGTRLYELCKKKGYLAEDRDSGYSDFSIKTEDFDREYLFKIINDFNNKVVERLIINFILFLLKNPLLIFKIIIILYREIINYDSSITKRKKIIYLYKNIIKHKNSFLSYTHSL